MEVKKDLKIKVGDCFAYEIKDDEKLKGRYFILCMVSDDFENPKSRMKYYRVKITPDNNLPTTEEEINALEDVITKTTIWEMRYFPFSGNVPYEQTIKERSKVKFYPDEYNLLNTFTIRLTISTIKQIQTFIYLGNFNVKKREDEYVYFSETKYPLCIIERLEQNLLLSYKAYNLKESDLYSDDPEIKEYLNTYHKEMWGGIEEYIKEQSDKKFHNKE